jgi:hypothetical protein
MSNPAQRQTASPDSTLEGEGSAVRAPQGGRARHESGADLRVEPASDRGHGVSYASVLTGSLDERIEQKLRRATELLRRLPMSDTRVRLLHAAVLRRDEALLDGVLRELEATR